MCCKGLHWRSVHNKFRMLSIFLPMRHKWNYLRLTRDMRNNRHHSNLPRIKLMQFRVTMPEQIIVLQLHNTVIMFIELIIICIIRNDLPQRMHMDNDLCEQTMHRFSKFSNNRFSLWHSLSRLCHNWSWLCRYICPLLSLLRNQHNLFEFQRF